MISRASRAVQTTAAAGGSPAPPAPANPVFEIAAADRSSVALAADAALAAPLIARTRAILWLSLLTGLAFTALEVAATPPRIAAPFFVKCAGISVISTALVVLRGAWVLRHARLLSIAVIIAAYLLTALSGIVSPSREYETTAVLFVVGALTSAILLPWGVWPQAGTVLVGAAALAVAVLRADGDLQVMTTDPAAAVVIGLILSVVAAYEVQRYRLALVEELGARRRAEAATRALNADLERRVGERTGELQAANEQLRALSARIQSVREEERTCVAREIHDELGQELTALRIDLDLLSKRVVDTDTGEVGALLRRKLADMSELAGTMVQSVRRIATDLRPTALDDLGLIAAVEWQALEFAHRSGVPCTFTREPQTIDLDQVRATALFRIVQEALTNVTRHAEAKTVSITLRADDGDALLEVRDDGRGIADQALRDPRSLGLLGIRERARLVGGTVDIWGVPGHGTTLRVRIPRHEDAA